MKDKKLEKRAVKAVAKQILAIIENDKGEEFIIERAMEDFKYKNDPQWDKVLEAVRDALDRIKQDLKHRPFLLG